MKNPIDIQNLADLRIREAVKLQKSKFYNGAFYLAGYAVELYLKAKICDTMDVPDFYDTHVPKSDLSKTFLIHNLDRLMLLSGLHTKFEAAKKTVPNLTDHWDKVLTWSEKSRYNNPNTKTEIEALEFIESSKIIMKWIKKH
jgi:HEPN domain-containing protein